MSARLATLTVTSLLILACSGGGSAGPSGTLLTLENGDIACYVLIQNDAGEEQTFDGDFDLCGTKMGLVGKKVSLVTQKANVQAGSCEGNPDCTDTEEVDLVVEINEQ